MTLLDDMLAAAQAAGEEILRIRTAGFAIRQKPDASPVTDADLESDRIIRIALAEAPMTSGAIRRVPEDVRPGQGRARLDPV